MTYVAFAVAMINDDVDEMFSAPNLTDDDGTMVLCVPAAIRYEYL